MNNFSHLKKHFSSSPHDNRSPSGLLGSGLVVIVDSLSDHSSLVVIINANHNPLSGSGLGSRFSRVTNHNLKISMCINELILTNI